MLYLEHYLREGGVESLSSVVILAAKDGEGICCDVATEILDVFPEARVEIVPAAGPVPSCDLLVCVFTAPWRFPFQDPVYGSLDQLEALLGLRSAARSVMLYGASWRSAEVVPSRSLPALARRRRIEARLIRLLERSRLLRRLLRPLYS